MADLAAQQGQLQKVRPWLRIVATVQPRAPGRMWFPVWEMTQDRPRQFSRTPRATYAFAARRPGCPPGPTPPHVLLYFVYSV